MFTSLNLQPSNNQYQKQERQVETAGTIANNQPSIFSVETAGSVACSAPSSSSNSSSFSIVA